MQISVTFKKIEPSEALKNYVTDRLTKFKRYLDGPVEAHVVLGLEKFRHLADVTIDSNGHIIKGREENTDMYAAIDLVMDKIDIQLKKFRDKLRSAKGDRSRAAAPAPAGDHLAVSGLVTNPMGKGLKEVEVEVLVNGQHVKPAGKEAEVITGKPGGYVADFILPPGTLPAK